MSQIFLLILGFLFGSHLQPLAQPVDGAALRCDADDEGPPDAAPRPPRLGGGNIDDHACVAAGGKCVAISSCAKGQGSMGLPSCGASGVVCCMTNCPEETFMCCDHGAQFRPVCADGKLECREGQHRCDE